MRVERLFGIFFKKKHVVSVSDPIWDSRWFRLGVIILCSLLIFVSFCLLYVDNTTTIDTSSPIAQNRARNAIQATNSEYPCSLKTDATKKCIFICVNITNGNPGEIVADFMEPTITECKNVELQIWYSVFPGGDLKNGWFPSKVKLKKLAIQRCTLEKIEDDAFYGMDSLQHIHLNGIGITELHTAVIKGLNNLLELYLNNLTQLITIESGILDKFPLFETLQMQMVRTLPSFLPNITGNNSKSQNTAIVDFGYNYLQILKPEFFTGLKKSISLYLTGNQIYYIEPGTFNEKLPQIQLLHLKSNNLETLSKDVFSANFFRKTRTNLEKNPWICNCDLAWLSQAMNDPKNLFDGNALCDRPEHLHDTPIKDANFSWCDTTTTKPEETASDEPSSTITSTEETTEQSTTTDNTVFTPDCENGTDEVQMAGSEEEMDEILQIEEIDEGIVQIYIGNSSDRWRLYWKGVQKNTKCWLLDNVLRFKAYKLQLQPEEAYTFCLLPGNSLHTSPINCLAHTMLPIYERRAWLTNKDKVVTIGLSLTGAFLACTLFAAGVYALVRKYPTLIKGNKRVLIVNHRAATALIMPKGYEPNLEQQKKPVSATTSTTSTNQSPRSSTTTYVSINEPTAAEIIAWRLERFKEKSKVSSSNTNNENDSKQTGSSPEVPPYPGKIISVSLRVDSLNSGYTSTA